MFSSFKLFFALFAFTAMAFAQTTPNAAGALFNQIKSSAIGKYIEFAENQVSTAPGQSEVDALLQEHQNAAG